MATAEDGEAERITVRQAVQQHVVRLWDTDPTVAARAAESLFELGVKGGYASVVATRNRQEIGMMEGVFPGFAHLVSHGTDEGQGWACAALAQIAFDNANNCIAIVRTPGMLAGLRQVMENSTRDSKAAAALAVNNISAFSEQASAIIVQAEVLNLNEADMERLSLVGCLQEAGLAGAVWEHRQRHGPFLSWDALHNVAGMTGRVAERAAASRHPNLVLSSEPSLLPALQALCRGELTDARTDAVGALNHMSRSDQARRLLLHHSILHQALGPALSAEYESAEELAAIVARATMAIANLMAHVQHLPPLLLSSPPSPCSPRVGG